MRDPCLPALRWILAQLDAGRIQWDTAYEDLPKLSRAADAFVNVFLAHAADTEEAAAEEIAKAKRLVVELLAPRVKRSVGRPRREFDNVAVVDALRGRSVRLAAKVLCVPQATLHKFVKDNALRESR